MRAARVLGEGEAFYPILSRIMERRLIRRIIASLMA